MQSTFEIVHADVLHGAGETRRRPMRFPQQFCLDVILDTVKRAVFLRKN